MKGLEEIKTSKEIRPLKEIAKTASKTTRLEGTEGLIEAVRII